MASKEALKTYFSALGCDVQDDVILKKCVELCNKYQLDGETFVEIWVSFAVPHFSDFNPTLDALKQLENTELKKPNKASSVEVDQLSNLKHEAHSSTQDMEQKHILETYSSDQSASAKVKRLRSPEVETETQEGKLRALDHEFTPSTYLSKPNTPGRYPSTNARGKVLLHFGPDVTSWKKEEDSDFKICKSYTCHVPKDAVYMCEMLSDQGLILTSICESLGEYICKNWHKASNKKIPYIRNVKSQSQSVFRTWGRICISVDKKSNIKAAMLEGCKRAIGAKSAGLVDLDLTSIKQYSVFPGQIVAVEGTNSTGSILKVNDLYSNGYAPMPKVPNLKRNLSIKVAAGPFTPTDNLHYQPLWDLMEQVKKEEPDILILIGPFLDFTHPEIRSASIKDTFQELFEKIVAKIMDRVQGTNIKVVLIPSNRDAHHDAVFPTPQYIITQSKIIQDTTNLYLMSDPYILNVEGLCLGVTSVDSIRHLGHNEITNICDLNLDLRLWEKYAFFDQQPHIMVLPSDMRFFCKIVNDCLVVNPERLQKYTYAKLLIPQNIDGKWISCRIGHYSNIFLVNKQLQSTVGKPRCVRISGTYYCCKMLTTAAFIKKLTALGTCMHYEWIVYVAVWSFAKI
ncbi:hypothetical protein KM043_001982 [Ampulex compressa]|nr:hypothetical protein KM043_001982 [Ampulex compressa]